MTNQEAYDALQQKIYNKQVALEVIKYQVKYFTLKDGTKLDTAIALEELVKEQEEVIKALQAGADRLVA